MTDSKEYAKKLIDKLNDGQTEVLIDFISSFFSKAELDEIEKEENGDK